MGNDSYNASYGDNTSFGGYMTPAPVGAHDFGGASDDEFANEPPLLEELGINLEHIVGYIFYAHVVQLHYYCFST